MGCLLMSRNLIEYASHLFNLMIGEANVPTRDKMRIAKNPDRDILQQELQDFQSISVEEVNYIVPGAKMAGISLRERHLVLITGISDFLSDSILKELEEVEISLVLPHTGVLLALVKDAFLRRNETLSEEYYEENIYYQQDDLHYSGHSLSDLIKCIEAFSIFEINKNSLLYCRNHRDVSQYICSFFQNFRALPLDPLLLSFQHLFVNGCSHLRNENIFNALTSAHWRHTFLELYRCIEALYSLPHAISLRDKLKIPYTGAEVAKACYGELGWKRREEESLKRIFQLMPNRIALKTDITNVELFENSTFDFSDNGAGKKNYEKIAELIYKIRNSLVHHLETTDEFIPFEEKDWIIIINFLLSTIDYIYSTYDHELIC